MYGLQKAMFSYRFSLMKYFGFTNMLAGETSLLNINTKYLLRVLEVNKTEHDFKRLLVDSGCSQETAEVVWKWYNCSAKHGARTS
jgi:hypothetical protein